MLVAAASLPGEAAAARIRMDGEGWMAGNHYYKATDGFITVFRATKQTYTHAFWRIREPVSLTTTDPVDLLDIVFSNLDRAGHWPAIEITVTEYERLVRAKIQRQVARAGLTGRNVDHFRFDNRSHESWVRNKDLTPAK
jgi:hypothetical protein